MRISFHDNTETFFAMTFLINLHQSWSEYNLFVTQQNIKQNTSQLLKFFSTKSVNKLVKTFFHHTNFLYSQSLFSKLHKI